MYSRVASSILLGAFSVLFSCFSHAQPPVENPLQPGDRSSLPVIDMHLHAVTETEFAALIAALPPQLTSIPHPLSNETPPESLDEYVSRLREILDRYNVVLAFLSGSVESVDRWSRAVPGRMIPALSMGRPDYDSVDNRLPTLDELRDLYRDNRLQGIGEVTAPYYGISPSDARYSRYFDVALEFDVPVGIHTGTSDMPTVLETFPDFRVRFGNPILLEDMLVRHRGLRVVMMHGGIPWQREAGIIMESYPNVYMDISPAWFGWPGDDAIFRRVADEVNDYYERGLGERVMYGTDNGFAPEMIGMGIEMLEGNPYLTEGQKRDILYNNAAQFLGLDQAVIDEHHR